jgi:DDE superfamily endonuclease
LVADTAFPRGSDAIIGRIRAPLKAGQSLRGTQEEIAYQMEFDRQLLSYRQTAEWGNRALKSCFGRLRMPLEIKHKERRGNLLETCIRAHCLRTRRVGLNEIQSVYEPHWAVLGRDGRVLSDWDNMLFADQRSNDRVASYHTVAIYE